MESNNEMSHLKSIIEYVFELDIFNKSRKRQYVDARMVFTKILYNEGYGSTAIARFLKKTMQQLFITLNQSMPFLNLTNL